MAEILIEENQRIQSKVLHHINKINHRVHTEHLIIEVIMIAVYVMIAVTTNITLLIETILIIEIIINKKDKQNHQLDPYNLGFRQEEALCMLIDRVQIEA